MSRYKAGLIHLAISAAIVAAALFAALFVWYPPPLFDAVGAGTLLFILAGVDVTLGPLLTTLIFRAGKPGLKFDLAFIALVQTAALAYGGYTMLLARPVYLVFSVDRFEVVVEADIPAEEQAKATSPEFRQSPLAGYRVVAARVPDDRKERDRITSAAVFAGHDLSHFPQHYVAYDASIARAALAKAHGIERVKEMKPAMAAELAQWLKRRNLREESVAVLPVRARKGDILAILDRAGGELLALAPFSWW